MLDYKVKIGLAPMRRDVTARPGMFNWEKAEERGSHIVKYIEDNFSNECVEFVDLKGINPVAVMYCTEDAEAVVEAFRKEKVDAVFIINCNFGNEEIAGYVAKELGKPVLIWAPLDDEFEEDGTRYTDSQCGLFGTSRILQRLHVPFSYIESCHVEDDIFKEGIQKFVSVSCMVKNFCGMKIAQIGSRPRPFYSVIYNEGELMEKFGITVLPVNLAVIQDKYQRILNEKEEELLQGAKLLEARYVLDELTKPVLKKIYAFVLLYQEICEEYKVDVISAECWSAMQLLTGAMPCVAYSILADMGYLISCESDVLGAISMALLCCASQGKKVPFFGEFTVRHPENKNAELLWHCGPFAYSLKKEGTEAKIVNMRGWMQVRDGSYTLARMDQDNGSYHMLVGNCRSTDGPYTNGTYLWAEFENLSRWEKKLVEGPYIHHMAEIEGDYKEVLKEFCKYVPAVSVDAIE